MPAQKKYKLATREEAPGLLTQDALTDLRRAINQLDEIAQAVVFMKDSLDDTEAKLDKRMMPITDLERLLAEQRRRIDQMRLRVEAYCRRWRDAMSQMLNRCAAVRQPLPSVRKQQPKPKKENRKKRQVTRVLRAPGHKQPSDRKGRIRHK